MRKVIINSSLLMLMLLMSGCQKSDEKSGAGSGTPVEISAAFSRAGEPARNDIYVKAYYTTGNVYFQETLARIPEGLDETVEKPIVFPGAKPYYPFGQQQVRIIAYSGKATGDNMNLVAGTKTSNDAILSNYGKSQDDADVDETYAPAGTLGSSVNPVEILQFRHVMTQLTVDFELGTPEIDVPPARLSFTLPDNSVVKTGSYALKTLSNELATPNIGSGAYAIQLGTNYLVPTGVDLVGKKLASLVIDNFTATSSDLNNYVITQAGPETEMKLLPGYAYRLTFTINRLKVTGIRLSKIDWIPQVVDGDLSYDPNTLTLELGAYSNSGDNAVNRVVLATTDGKEYIGKTVENQMGVKFVTLPQNGMVNRVSLFTERGMLLTSSITSTQYQNNTLTLPVSAGGMILENPSNLPGPDNPYLVTTPVQFMNIDLDLTANYKQAATVDLNTLNLIGEERLFNGFGDFTGTFTGNGHRIDGIDIQSTGLFKSLGSAGILQNIRLTGGTIDATGQDHVGSIVGINNGTIVACVNEAHITNSAEATTVQGGIVGINSATGRVVACVNTGTVLEGQTVGGICGINQNIDANVIVSCVNTGMLNPNAVNLGYIVGQSLDSSLPVISTCFGLVGSAQHVIGSPESAVGSGNVITNDTAVMEPSILRNGVPPGGGEADRVVNRLNEELNTETTWGMTYKFTYDDPTDPNDPVTGITWPAPIML